MTGWIVALIIMAVAGLLIWHLMKGSEHRETHVTQPTQAQQRNRPVPLSQKTETGPMVYYANDTHGAADKEYRFNYKKVNGAWRAYILRMPSLGNRDPKSIPTHRLWDEENKPYICWKGTVNSLKDMQNISRVWADCIQEYIATGKRFGPE